MKLAILYTYATILDAYKQQPNHSQVCTSFEAAQRKGEEMIYNEECLMYDITIL